MDALIVDDSRAMRRILRQILEPLGFQISEARNGLEAMLCLADRPQTELAFVDWNMPEMNGLDFIITVRKDARFQAIKRLW